jgi:hypothetical protein
VGLLALVSLAHPGHAADLACAAGDVACLITAINTANATGEATTITLAAGTYTLTTVDNTTDGPNGLPSVTGMVTITGAGADATILEREASAPGFRLGHVAATGHLTLDRLTMRRFGGFGSPAVGGGGLLNSGGVLTLTNSTFTASRAEFGGCIFTQEGTVLLVQTRLTDCFADEGGGIFIGGGQVVLVQSTVADSGFGSFTGGGISNERGTVTLVQSQLYGNDALVGGGLTNVGTGFITDSTIADNAAFECAGGICNGGTLTIQNSTIVDNQASRGSGGISNVGTLTILNSTIAHNTAGFLGGVGGIVNSARGGGVLIVNSTIADNQARPQGGPGLGDSGGIVGSEFVLLNTLLARNTVGDSLSEEEKPADCVATGISLGTNLIGDPTGCTITLLPSDLTGDPGLATFRDNGRPGNGHIPLLKTSQAIDAGNKAGCPRTDQLGRLRLGPCDIGAIEFRHRDNHQHDKDLAAAARVSQ